MPFRLPRQLFPGNAGTSGAPSAAFGAEPPAEAAMTPAAQAAYRRIGASEDAAFVAETVASSTLEWPAWYNAHWQARQEAGTPEGFAGETEGWIQSWIETRLARAPSPAAREQARRELAAGHQTLSTMALRQEHHGRQTAQLDRVTTGLDLLGQRAAETPDSLPALLASGEALIDGAAGMMPAEALVELRGTFRARTTVAATRALIAIDPRRARQRLDEPGWTARLDASTRSTLQGEAEAAVKLLPALDGARLDGEMAADIEALRAGGDGAFDAPAWRRRAAGDDALIARVDAHVTRREAVRAARRRYEALRFEPAPARRAALEAAEREAAGGADGEPAELAVLLWRQEALLARDPAAAAFENPHVAKAWQEARAGRGTVGAALTLTATLQAEMGVTAPRLLPAAERSALVAQLNALPEPARAAHLRTLVAEAGPLGPRLAGELLREGLSPALLPLLWREMGAGSGPESGAGSGSGAGPGSGTGPVTGSGAAGRAAPILPPPADAPPAVLDPAQRQALDERTRRAFAASPLGRTLHAAAARHGVRADGTTDAHYDTLYAAVEQQAIRTAWALHDTYGDAASEAAVRMMVGEELPSNSAAASALIDMREPGTAPDTAQKRHADDTSAGTKPVRDIAISDRLANRIDGLVAGRATSPELLPLRKHIPVFLQQSAKGLLALGLDENEVIEALRAALPTVEAQLEQMLPSEGGQGVQLVAVDPATIVVAGAVIGLLALAEGIRQYQQNASFKQATDAGLANAGENIANAWAIVSQGTDDVLRSIMGPPSEAASDKSRPQPAAPTSGREATDQIPIPGPDLLDTPVPSPPAGPDDVDFEVPGGAVWPRHAQWPGAEEMERRFRDWTDKLFPDGPLNDLPEAGFEYLKYVIAGPYFMSMGGRLGNPDTRKSDDAVVKECTKIFSKDPRIADYLKHEFGGTVDGEGVERKGQEYVEAANPVDGSIVGSSFPDVSFIVTFDPNRLLGIRFNTVTTWKDGLTPTAKEVRQAQRLVKNLEATGARAVVSLIPKFKTGMDYDKWLKIVRARCRSAADEFVDLHINELKNVGRAK